MNQQILTKLVIESSDKDGWLDREKFAELIVQECVNALQNNRLWNSDISRALDEHFGVK